MADTGNYELLAVQAVVGTGHRVGSKSPVTISYG